MKVNPFTIISRESGVSAEKLAWDSLKPEPEAKHVRRLEYDGLSLRCPGSTPSTQQEVLKFYANHIVKSENGCWLWVGTIRKTGYATICIGCQRVTLHRFAYMLHYGEVDPKLLVCHHCDNRACVNPHHLFLGTAGDNSRDCEKKSRRPHAPGELAHRAKLTQKDVDMIRQREATEPKLRHIDLARIYGVSRSNIWMIVNRRTFR